MALPGKTILITRAASQSRELREGLQMHGARVVECPAIEIVPVEDWSEIDRAIARLDSYDWLLFTSTNAVDHFMRRVRTLGMTCSVPIAVVGSATAEQLTRWQLSASLIPNSFHAEGLLEVFPSDIQGKNILFPRAEDARDLLPEELRRRQAIVDVLTVYRTVKSVAQLAGLRGLLATEKIDVLVFTSPSAIRFFAETLGPELVPLLKDVAIAVIGPVARKSAESVGLQPVIEPKQATIPDLVAAIQAY